MVEALRIWRLFPTKIAADLREFYHGVTIGQWHRGEMSSRELLELIEELPVKSRYKGASRGYQFGVDYEWAPEEYREAALVRQLAPLNDDGGMSVTQALYEAYFSPVERKQLEVKQANEAERRDRGSRFVLGQALGLGKAVT